MNQHRVATIRAALSALSDAIATAWQYAVAIDAISARYRLAPDDPSADHLYRIYYRALWEALIVRLEVIYDKTKGSNSFNFVAVQLDKLGTEAGTAASREIRSALDNPTAQRISIKRWRQDVVAHRRFDLDTERFDTLYPLKLSDAESSLHLAERLLSLGAACIHEPGWNFEFLKEEVMEGANLFLRQSHATLYLPNGSSEMTGKSE